MMNFSPHKQLCYFKEPDAVKAMLCASLTHFPTSNITEALDICGTPFMIGQDTKLRIPSDRDRKRSTLLVRFQALSLAPFQGFLFSSFLSLLLALLQWLILLICSNSLLFFKNNSWEMCIHQYSLMRYLLYMHLDLHACAQLCLCRVII